MDDPPISASSADDVPVFRIPNEAPSSAGSSPQAPTLSEWLGGPEQQQHGESGHTASVATTGGET